MLTEPVISSNSTDDKIYLKHYVCGKILGEGGYGQVFEAWDSKLQRQVAIKQLKNIESIAHSANLFKEARLAASLQHPAFVKIYAIEDEQSTPAIIMERVNGQTLKQLLQKGGMSIEQAVDVVNQVAQAMVEAHQHGLTHGDLKPSNLMVEENGRVRILDFGLASKADPNVTASIYQMEPQGTIAYMAPELLTGAPSTPKRDVFALGVIFYECLQGCRPFPDLSGLALAAALMQTNSDKWQFSAHYPQAVMSLIIAMTARQPEKRIADMQAVIAQINILQAQLFPKNSHYSGSYASQTYLNNLPIKSPYFTKRSRLGLALIFSLLVVFGIWKSLPYFNIDVDTFKPYSEAMTLQQGLEALRLYDRPGSLDKAEQSFETILKHNPKSAAAAAGLSIAYSNRYKVEFNDEALLKKAEASAQQALQLNNFLALSIIAKARVDLLKGNAELALSEYEKALELDVQNVFANSGKILTLIELKRYEAAEKFAQQLLIQHPKESAYADDLGVAFYEEDKLDKAQEAFELSIKIEPNGRSSYANLAGALVRKNQETAAMQVLQQGLQVQPNDLLYSNLGTILFMRSDYVGAVNAFEQAVSPDKGNPRDYLNWANLADALLWLPGRKNDAKQAYAKAEELLQPLINRSPKNATFNSQMGLYAARVGDKNASQHYISTSLSLAANDPNIHFRAGMAYELLNDRSAAINELIKAVQLGYPKNYIESEPDLIELRKDKRYTF